MNLTNLRRLVLLADVLALAGAGAAAWFSLQAAPVAAKDWQKLFPVRTAQPSDFLSSGPANKEQYTAAVTYAQGDKPVIVEKGPAAPVAVVDDFATKYRLYSIFVGSSLDSSFAQLQTGTTIFSVDLGSQIPAELGTGKDSPPLTPWRLNELREAGWDLGRKQVTPCQAIFTHVETGERKVLEMLPGNPNPTLQSPEAPSGPGIGVSRRAGPSKDQAFRARRILDPDPDVVAWEYSEEEVEYMEVFSADEVSRVSTVESRDSEGKPDGFVFRGVPAGSRAHDVGFRQEDKVVSVNNEKVSSTADAMAKGKKQFEAGTSVFQLKVLRKGKEMTFTFHAPKKKARP